MTLSGKDGKRPQSGWTFQPKSVAARRSWSRGERCGGRGKCKRWKEKSEKEVVFSCYFKKNVYLCSDKMWGREFPFLLLMIDKFKVLDIVKDVLEGSDKYLINMKITPDNRIFVDIDGDNGINIDDCIEVSRAIESQLDRDEEDFELNVSSAGADSPLKMPRQYRRHVGRELNVTPFDGEQVEGTLMEADDQHFVIKIKGKKKESAREESFAYEDVKTAKVVVKI